MFKFLEIIKNWCGKDKVKTYCSNCGNFLWTWMTDGEYSIYRCRFCGKTYSINLYTGAVKERKGKKLK